MRFHDFFGGFYPNGRNSDWQRDPNEDEDNFFSDEHSGDESQFNDDWFNNDGDKQGRLYRFGVDGFHDDLFSIMDQFMKGFGANHFPSFGPNQLTPDQSLPPVQEPSLRDQVLKKNPDTPNTHDILPRQPPEKFNSLLQDFFGQSFFAPFLEEVVPKEDKDLDEEVMDKGLDLILDQPSASCHAPVPFGRRGHFVFHGMQESRSTIRRSDGSSEQRVTKRDSQGNEETTIIYESADGQCHTVVEHRKSDGTLDNAPESSNWRSGVLKDHQNSQAPGSGLFSQMIKVFEEIFPR